MVRVAPNTGKQYQWIVLANATNSDLVDKKEGGGEVRPDTRRQAGSGQAQATKALTIHHHHRITLNPLRIKRRNISKPLTRSRDRRTRRTIKSGIC